MTLLSSISGIRGTLGGKQGENLTPFDIIKFTTGFVNVLSKENNSKLFILGRDGRKSGQWIAELVRSTVVALGYDIIDLNYTTTPTIEMVIPYENACGGIIITASHNPIQWNALKLLNSKGEFISAELGQNIIAEIENENFTFANHTNSGTLIPATNDYGDYHIKKILELPYVDVPLIKKKKLRVVLDPINSVGVTFIPPLLKKLGIESIEIVHGDIEKDFEHNPEPLPQNLKTLSEKVVELNFDLGISVDPDCDRLCFVCENGDFFGEEYTLAVIADLILSQDKGAVVTNLSSSRVVKDIAQKFDCSYFATKVGEVNVVEKMKEVDAIFGGEGNGGVILPALHYGRDALVGIALFLTRLVQTDFTLSGLKRFYPEYHMTKEKVELSTYIEWEKVVNIVKGKFSDGITNEEDGLKIDFENSWFHIRRSNTEPIVRIYSEALSVVEADALNISVKHEILKIK